MWSLKKYITGLPGGQKGISLIETMVGIGILGAIGVVFLVSMNTAYKNVGEAEEQIQTESLIRSQLEYIKDGAYADDGVYPVVVDLPAQYTMVISTEVLDTPTCAADGNCNTLQVVTVSIYRPLAGAEDELILAVSAYKAKI